MYNTLSPENISILLLDHGTDHIFFVSTLFSCLTTDQFCVHLLESHVLLAGALFLQ